MILVGLGDSWAWGTELLDPEHCKDLRNASFHLHHEPVHIKYRESNRYLKLFGDMIGATQIVDLSRGGASNDTVVRNLTRWLASNGYTSGRSTEDLFVSIGWTSPERKDFHYNENVNAHGAGWFTLYPYFKHDYKKPGLEEFYKLYVQYLWNEGEYIQRYFSQVYQAESLLKHLGIKYLMHQAFYQNLPHILLWKDRDFQRKLSSIDPADMQLWKSVDEHRFMHKNDTEIHTFHNYVLDLGGKDTLVNQHPSVLGHRLWAEHMYEYCKENNLL